MTKCKIAPGLFHEDGVISGIGAAFIAEHGLGDPPYCDGLPSLRPELLSEAEIETLQQPACRL